MVTTMVGKTFLEKRHAQAVLKKKKVSSLKENTESAYPVSSLTSAVNLFCENS